MWLRSLIAGMTGAVLAALVCAGAVAGDIPVPMKKPRDKTGAVITTPDKTTTQKTTPDKVSPTPEQPKSDRKLPATVEKTTPTAKPPLVSTASPNVESQQDTVKKTPSPSVEKVPAATTATPPASAATPATAPAEPPVPTEWAAQDIELAKTRCTVILKGVVAVTVPEPAFRDGECGAPAAVRLISLGKNPQISLDPPAVLTCDMVQSLHHWMNESVQPLAKKHLGSEIIKIQTMSDYSCRNAYGRTKGKLSEHGRANALDIRGFVTAKAQPAYVLESWGPIQREIAAAAKEAARLTALKAAAEKTAAEQAAAGIANSKTGAAVAAPVISAVAPPSKGTIAEGLQEHPGTKGLPREPAMGFQSSRLGGPKDRDKSKGVDTKGKTAQDFVKGAPAGGQVAVFLHEAHASACRIFGTTLGPEANNDHRNHFHVDMAPRKTTKICD